MSNGMMNSAPTIKALMTIRPEWFQILLLGRSFLSSSYQTGDRADTTHVWVVTGVDIKATTVIWVKLNFSKDDNLHDVLKAVELYWEGFQKACVYSALVREA